MLLRFPLGSGTQGGEQSPSDGEDRVMPAQTQGIIQAISVMEVVKREFLQS